MIAAMDIIGPKMESGEMFIPEVLLSADTMKIGLELIKPMLDHQAASSRGRVIMGTVNGDMHDIGKNLVITMLEASGFDVIDIGIDQPVQSFLDACEKERPDIVGLSALLTTTMGAMQDTCEALKERYGDIKVIVGGAPVTEDFASQIGADGYAADAGSAAVLCRELMA